MRLLVHVCFGVLAFLSLLVWVSAAGLCARSYFVGDMWLWYDRDCSECANAVMSGAGRVRYGWSDNRMLSGINMVAGHYTGATDRWMYTIARGGGPHVDIPGARCERYGAQSWVVEIRYVWPLVIFGVAPAVWVWRFWRRRRRREAGCCRVCGYDLRATPDRCPECGSEVVEKSRSAKSGTVA
jgi:hypothetical protein